MTRSDAHPSRLVSDRLSPPHGFFTREGGVSEGAYASLNCSLNGGDDPARVMENRARIAQALDTQPDRLMGLSQIHSATVATVDRPWRAGEGPRADAMVTSRPGLAIGVITADCAPVLLADAEAGVIAAAHAGWRGALAGILERTVDAMVALGAAPHRIAAVIGPCIGQSSYEVSADLRDPLLAQSAGNGRFFAEGYRDARWQFDLASYCGSRLASVGIGAIEALGADTLADPERFFSHRRRTLAGGGVIGHQMSAIALPGSPDAAFV